MLLYLLGDKALPEVKLVPRNALRRHRRERRWAAALSTLAALPLLLAPAPLPAQVGSTLATLAEEAGSTPPGGFLRLGEVPLGDATVSLELQPFEVFAADAQIVAHGPHGESLLRAPRSRYFRGLVKGDPSSYAFLAVGPDRTVRGLVGTAEGLFLIGPEGAPTASGEARTVIREAVADGPLLERIHTWSCGNDFGGDLVALPAPVSSPPAGAPQPPAGDVVVTARIAIDTDAEFLDLFGGSIDDAVSYVGDLVGAISAIYFRDIQTNLQVSHLFLWTGGAANDPWTACDPPSFTCVSEALVEFRNYWSVFRTSVNRTVAHFMSGKPLAAGMAYLGVLCDPSFGYGVSLGLSGSFNPANPSSVWDIRAVSHEIGHNFNSPHTHCYMKVGDNPEPVDRCYNGEAGYRGCWDGVESLPTNGGGSIMSYCHVLAGGGSNINLFLGREGFYGTASERVQAQMRSHVEAASCIDLAF